MVVKLEIGAARNPQRGAVHLRRAVRHDSTAGVPYTSDRLHQCVTALPLPQSAPIRMTPSARPGRGRRSTLRSPTGKRRCSAQSCTWNWIHAAASTFNDQAGSKWSRASRRSLTSRGSGTSDWLRSLACCGRTGSRWNPSGAPTDRCSALPGRAAAVPCRWEVASAAAPRPVGRGSPIDEVVPRSCRRNTARLSRLNRVGSRYHRTQRPIRANAAPATASTTARVGPTSASKTPPARCVALASYTARRARFRMPSGRKASGVFHGLKASSSTWR